MDEKNEHLSFDEMVDFACYDKYDNNLKEMAARVNSHLVKCKDCSRVYSAIYATKEALDRYTSGRNTVSKVKFYAISALLQTEKKLGVVKNSVEQLFDSIDISYEKMKLSIIDLSRIESKSNSMGLSFIHPCYSSYAKTHGKNNGTNEAIDSVLIDGKSRVKVDLDGSLTIEFDAKYCTEGALLFLIPSDDNYNSYAGITRKKSNGLVCVVFDDVKPGEYQLVANMESA